MNAYAGTENTPQMTPTERQVYVALREGLATVPKIKRRFPHVIADDIKAARRSLRDKGLADYSVGSNTWHITPRHTTVQGSGGAC